MPRATYFPDVIAILLLAVTLNAQEFPKDQPARTAASTSSSFPAPTFRTNFLAPTFPLRRQNRNPLYHEII